mgnify:CR=1 FL=1
MIQIENHTFEYNNTLYSFKNSNKGNTKYAPYYLVKHNPYEYISGLFLIDKKKMIFQGKTKNKTRLIYYLNSKEIKTKKEI